MRNLTQSFTQQRGTSTLSLVARLGLLTLLLVGCGQERQAAELTAATPARIDSLVTAEWLREILEDPNLVVLDCTVLIEQAEVVEDTAAEGDTE